MHEVHDANTILTMGVYPPNTVLSQQCYNEPNCAGDVVSGPTTAEECYVGTDDGMSFGVSGGTCKLIYCLTMYR